MSTLDDFFGCKEEQCIDCGTTENLIGIGWDAIEKKPIQYLCKSCGDKRNAERAMRDAKLAEEIAILNEIARTDA